MRYEDCPTAEANVHIRGSAPVVWALVSDIALSTRFSPELQAVEWLGGATEPVLGASFRGHNRHAAIGTWSVICTITAYEPERILEWTVGDVADPSAVWRFTVEPEDGGVMLTESCQLGPGPSGLSRAITKMPDKEERIIARRLAEHQANMKANLDGVNELAEEAAG